LLFIYIFLYIFWHLNLMNYTIIIEWMWCCSLYIRRKKHKKYVPKHSSTKRSLYTATFTPSTNTHEEWNTDIQQPLFGSKVLAFTLKACWQVSWRRIVRHLVCHARTQAQIHWSFCKQHTHLFPDRHTIIVPARHVTVLHIARQLSATATSANLKLWRFAIGRQFIIDSITVR